MQAAFLFGMKIKQGEAVHENKTSDFNEINAHFTISRLLFDSDEEGYESISDETAGGRRDHCGGCGDFDAGTEGKCSPQ